MMRTHRLLRGVLTVTLLVSASVLRAQERSVAPSPAGTAGAASQSAASGQRSEPEANVNKESEDPAAALKRPSSSVAKLGGMVGMSPETSVFVFNWLNFFLLAAAVLYMLARMLPKAFRTRSESIQKNIVEARVATEEARARLSAVEARLSRLDGEIAALRSEHEKAAADEEQRLRQQAEEEKARILQAADQEIASASAAAQRSLRAYAAEIAVQRAAAQLTITPDDDRVLIENFASKLHAEGSRN